MRPRFWNPPVELSAAEQKVVSRIKRAKLFTFLRQVRHELFDEAFQAELATLYDDKAKGHPPVAPAQLCLTLIVQAYTGASNDEAIEALQMDLALSWCWIWTGRRHRLAKGRWWNFERR